MPSEVAVHAIHRGKMRITADARGQKVEMDYPIGPECAGLTPLELLLVSLAGCSGNTLAHLLGKMKQPLEGLEVAAKGKRRDKHPTVFTEISLEFLVRGIGVERNAVEKALLDAETRVCPVWAMLKDGTKITSSFKIVGE